MTASSLFRRIRTMRGISLRELSRQSGIAYPTLHHYDHGLRVAATHVIRLAAALGVDPSELACRERDGDA